MKAILKRLLPIMYLLLLLTGSIHAYDVACSSYVPITADVPGTANFSIKVKSIGADVEQSSVTWSDQIVGSGWQMADTYVEMNVDCNHYLWKVHIYTDNTDASTSLIQKSGLLSATTNTSRIPLGWIISDSTLTTLEAGEPGELLKYTVNGSTVTTSAPWMFVKDKNDQDDPNTTAWVENWDSALSEGYTVVLWGTHNYTYLPYNVCAESPVIIYFEGEFYYADGKTRYESTLWFDFIAY